MDFPKGGLNDLGSLSPSLGKSLLRHNNATEPMAVSRDRTKRVLFALEDHTGCHVSVASSYNYLYQLNIRNLGNSKNVIGCVSAVTFRKHM